MSWLALALGIAAFLSAMMCGAWSVALKTQQSGWIDATWSVSVGAAGVLAALAPIEMTSHWPRQVLVASLVALWALRLGSHIALRTLQGGDDPRYAQLKKEWGGAYRRKLFTFLQIQAAAAGMLALTVAAAARNPVPELRVQDFLGVAILTIAIVGEGVADRQLTKFRQHSKGGKKVCDVGLWSWSRHPNYFFEWLCWLAYPLIAIDFSGLYPFGWISLIGPIFMYWLLVHVSGIPLLEAHMMRSRGSEFETYKARVSAFWPLPPAQR